MKLRDTRSLLSRSTVASPRPQASSTRTMSAPARGLGQLARDVEAASSRLLGADAPVFAKRITTDQFKDKIREAKKAIVDAEGFDVAFQERILQDPLLLAAFKGYLSAIMAGTAKANAKKKSDAEVIDNRISVMEFLQFFEEKLGEMKELRDSADVDMTKLGLEVIERNSDIQTYLEDPMILVKTLREMATVPGLDDEARRSFLTRMAKAAAQSVSLAEDRTPEKRQAAFDVLTEALGELSRSGASKAEVVEYYREATRLAKELDGESGRAHQIRTEAIFLEGSKPADAKAARAKIRAHVDGMVAGAEKRDQALDASALESFEALVSVAKKDPELFVTVPEVLSHLREAAPQADGTPYKPHKTEVETFNRLVGAYVSAIGPTFPKLDDDGARAGHLAACEGAQGLVLEALAADTDNSMAGLVGQLTRHADLAGKAVELLDLIQNGSRQLDALEAAVKGFLENGQLDQAYELFFSELWDRHDDGQKTARQMRIFDKATEAGLRLLEEDGKLPGQKPTREWVASAYMRGVDACLNDTNPDLVAAARILERLADGPTPLTPDQTEDVVSKFRERCKTHNFPITHFAPGLVGLLARHSEDVGLMNTASGLLDQVVRDHGNFGGANQADWGGKKQAIDLRASTMELLRRISGVELLSGNVRRVAASAVHSDAAAGIALAQNLARLGRFANREELAQLVDVDQDLPQAALAFASTVETTKMARDLVVRYADQHLGTDAAEMAEGVRTGMVKMEAALRLAVPNLMTEHAMVGLVRAVQEAKAPKESLRLLRTHAPKDLITRVLEQVDDGHIRDYLSGARRKQKSPASPPDVGEGVPVAVVDGQAEPPKE